MKFFGKTQEDIIKLATENGFELDWLINCWDSIIEDKDILKPIIAVFPKYAKDMINIAEANTKINNLIVNILLILLMQNIMKLLKWLINRLIIINKRISLRMLVMMKFMLNLNVEKQINLLNNPT